MRERGILFALLAGMGAITYHSTSSPGTPSERIPTAVASSGRSGFSESELAKTFDKFDKRRKFTIVTTTDGLRLTADPLPDLNKRSDPLQYDWTLAIVPDPEHSNLKLYFDREVEAIQLAAANAGYQFERYWFPWKTDAASGKEAAYEIGPEAGDPDDKFNSLRVAPEQDNRDSLPGVLLFRNGHTAPLAVFLVSESPTGGIAHEEFRNAVCLGQKLRDLSCNEDKGPLRIIGPGLSGSLASLSTLIETQRPSMEIFIRTWTHDETSNRHFREDLRLAGGQDTHFQPVVVSSNESTRRFINYVRSNWNDNTPILLLTEEATAFGGLGGLEGTKEGRTVYRIPFPRNLSQLRNASEKQDHIPGLGDTSRPSNVPRNGIWMSLKQESSADLELPTFSKEQTPVSQESVLFTIGDLLKTGTIHYAGIYATDPLDTLFLARYLRSACPNIRIFTISPDLLFEHGSDSADYSGILGVSPFPLFPLSQVWSAESRPEPLYVFPDGISEAIYNAALEVLHDVPGSSIHNKPLKGIDRRDLVDPFSRSSGAVWLTVAGRSGFEPIAVLNPGVTSENPQGRFPPEYWPGWGYAFIIILSFCLAFCMLMLFARPTGRRAMAFFSAQLDQDDLNGAYDPIPRAFHLLSIGLCLSTLLEIWLVVPAFIFQWNVTSGFHVEIAGLILGTAGMVTVCTLRFVFGVPDPSAKPRLQFDGILRIHPLGSTSALVVPVPLFWAASLLLKPPLPQQQTHVLLYLWCFFCLGSFCTGATIAAAALPFWNIREANKRQKAHKYNAPTNLFSTPYLLGIISITGFVALMIGIGFISIGEHTSSNFLAAYRSLDLTNGVSPLVPLTLLFAALAILAFVQLRRMAYYEERRPEVPRMGDIVHPTLLALVREIENRIRKFTVHPLHWLMLAVLVPFGFRLFFGSAQTLEARPLELLLVFAATGVGTFVLLIWIRLMLVWSAFSEFLQQLERHPIRQVFSLLPKGFIWSPAWQGGGKKRTHVVITRSLECMQALSHHPNTPSRMKEKLRKQLDSKVPDSLAANIKVLLSTAAKRRRLSRAKYRQLEIALRRIAQMAIGYLNQNTWCRGDYELKAELAFKEARDTSSSKYQEQELATICSELVAFRLLAFINFVLWHIDNLVTYISVGFLLLVIALSSYAFRSHTNIDWMMAVLFLVLTAGIVIVFAQADRDAILSRITGTEEGKLDRHFFTHLISYGGIPVLVLLATHFPTIGRFFFSWIKPALEAIH